MDMDSFTKIFLHFDGENGSTDIIDEVEGNIWSGWAESEPPLLPVLDTTYQYAGISSLKIRENSTVDLIGGFSEDLNPGDEDFTFDFYIRFGSYPVNMGNTIEIDGESGDQFIAKIEIQDTSYFTVGGNVICGELSVNLAFCVESPIEIVLNQFHHFEICRHGEYYLFFWNGLLKGTEYVGSHTFDLTGYAAMIVCESADVWIDEFQYSKGIARHTESCEVSPDSLQAITGLSGELRFQYRFTGNLQSIAALSGTPENLWPRINRPGLNAIAGTSGRPRPLWVSPPALKAQAGLSGHPLYALSVPALSVTAGLSAGEFSVFAESDDYIITYICRVYPAYGKDFITLPLSSFQGRFKSGDPSYLSVVVPSLDYAQDIADLLVTFNRQNYLTLLSGGEVSAGDSLYTPVIRAGSGVSYPELAVYIRKTFGDGNVIERLLMAVNLENIDTYEGATEQSIILEGHRTRTFTQKIVDITGASYRNTGDGKLRYRCATDLYLRPGDTVNINGETFTADDISIFMSPDSETFEFAQGIPSGSRMNPVLLLGGDSGGGGGLL
jgi:hypothetical protein